MPLDDEEDEDEDDEDDELLLDEDDDDDDTSPEEDELLLDEEASPDEDELLELEDELLLASLPPIPPIPPTPLVEDDVPLAAPAPVVVTGWASLHAPPNVAAQRVTNPVRRAKCFTDLKRAEFVSDS